MIDLHIQTAFYDKEHPILSEFQMRVEKGELVSIVAPSGAGKSTILKIIAGLHRGFEGTLAVEKNARIALIPQNQSLLPWKTVYENIVLLSKVGKHVGKDEEKEKVSTLLKTLGLAGYADTFPERLSGGQYKRVAFGQAFFYEPDILLMDEPFSGLDIATKTEIQELYLQLHRKNNMTTVFVTHDAKEMDDMKSRKIEL